MNLAATLLGAALVVVIVSSYLSKQKADEELRERADVLFSELSDLLTTPLWNYSEREIGIIGEAYIKNDFLSYLVVSGSDGQVLFKSENLETERLFEREGQIKYSGETIGRIRIAMSGRQHQELANQFLKSYIMTVGIVLVITLMIGAILLRRFLSKPIDDFVKLVEDYSAGNKAAFKRGSLYSEFAPLVAVLEKMGETIAAHISLLEDNEKNLERTIQERTQDLIDEKQRAETYLKVAGSMIVALDHDGKVSLINDRGCEVLGYAKHDLLGKDWFETVIPQEQRQQVRDVFREILNEEIEPVTHYENHVVTREGKRRLVSWENAYIKGADGKIIGCLSSGTDITIQRETQSELENEFNLNQAILTGSPVGISLYDDEGNCLSTNQATADIVGGTPEQVMSYNFHDLTPWKESGLYGQAVECQATGRPVHYEAEVSTMFGRKRFLEWRISVLTVNNKKHLLVILNDLTEARDMHKQLVQSAKMATLGEMATGIAHELNQPLNVIRMAVNNIQRKMDKNATSPDYLAAKLDKIDAQVGRATTIIDHMRIFGRKPDTSPEALDPLDVVHSTLGLIGEQLRLANIQVEVEAPDVRASFLGFQVLIEQVLLNLLANSRDSLKALDALDKRISIAVASDANDVTITVEDTGGGILESNLPHVFDPFFTTKGVGEGTGLGLSISYGIISDMGGTMTASNTGDGARFVITLPVQPAATPHDDPMAASR